MSPEDVQLTRDQIARQARKMSHWLNVAKELYESKDEAHIISMLHTELETKKRYYIVQRIYAHYNSIRRQRELLELREWNRRKIQSDISPNESKNLVA